MDEHEHRSGCKDFIAYQERELAPDVMRLKALGTLASPLMHMVSLLVFLGIFIMQVRTDTSRIDDLESRMRAATDVSAALKEHNAVEDQRYYDMSATLEEIKGQLKSLTESRQK